MENKDLSKIKIEEIQTFLEDIMNKNHDYNTIVDAIGDGVVATAWAMNNHENGGITGFQASCVMWNFIMKWSYSNNKCGLRIIDFDEMLYPQYECKFTEKTISQDTFNALQKEASRNLSNKDYAHENVIKHWESILQGNVPFGYTIRG